MSWHRGLLAGGLAAGAVALGLQALQPPPPPTVDVLAPVADLPGGVRLTSADLRPVALPEDIVPEGALRPDEDVGGRVLAGPVRAGEPLTDVRLLGRSLLDGWGDALVATPVRVADEGAVALVRPGDRVDLIATDTMGEAQAHVVAAGVPVLATPPGGEDVSFTEGALLVVASSREQAGRLAAAAVTSRLSLSLRPPPSDP
ncbi:MAG TPA: RcpC/CpaB family pilus assembly protein [Jiangellales bacterium]|nr:RcpC/CpaB family pilus assembly protein [Jiangellales bacterium]